MAMNESDEPRVTLKAKDGEASLARERIHRLP